jgi:hypothetical protein
VHGRSKLLDIVCLGCSMLTHTPVVLFYSKLLFFFTWRVRCGRINKLGLAQNTGRVKRACLSVSPLVSQKKKLSSAAWEDGALSQPESRSAGAAQSRFVAPVAQPKIPSPLRFPGNFAPVPDPSPQNAAEVSSSILFAFDLGFEADLGCILSISKKNSPVD